MAAEYENAVKGSLVIDYEAEVISTNGQRYYGQEDYVFGNTEVDARL